MLRMDTPCLIVSLVIMATNLVLEKKAQQWHESVQYIQKAISAYSQEEIDAFDDLLMAIAETNVKSMFLIEKCKLLSTFANQIAVKDSVLSTHINQFTGICESIYGKPDKFVEFKQILRSKGWISNWEKRKEEERNWQKEQEQKWQEEEKRKAREREEQRKREEAQRRWEEQQKRIREEQERREYEERRARIRLAQEREQQRRKKKKQNRMIVLIIGIIVFMALAHQYVYVPYTIDRDAPRTYVFATNLFLRSSKVADVEYNRIGKIPYGAELITYSNSDGWAEVKVDGQRGVVSSDYLLDYDDFHLLNGVWGNEDAKETIITAKCRLAILDYLKRHGLKTGGKEWVVYTKNQEVKPNTVFFPRLANGYNNYTDFAFILTNNETKERKLVLYSFTEDEKPVLMYEENAPQEGDIKNITYNTWNKKYKVTYSGKIQTAQRQTTGVVKPVSVDNVHDCGLVITDVVFANVDYDNNVLTSYGGTLYSDMQYLKPKVYFKKTEKRHKTVKFQVKLYTPDMALCRSNDSPVGYTMEETVNIENIQGNTLSFHGWGNRNGKFYVPGKYIYEIWYDGIKLYTATITVVQTDNKLETSETADGNRVYTSVDKMPQYPDGGMVGVTRFINNNIKYPVIAQENGVQGRVTVSFIIEKDGSVTNAKVIQGVDSHLDKEALRVVSSMPKWYPATRQGIAVRCQYTIPVMFKLQ